MVARDVTPPSDRECPDYARKRVYKACDRCRLKKSKCNGVSPCSRCCSDNMICVYGEQKRRFSDKRYPKGYVELLEQQQTWLVQGLQQLYHCTINAEVELLGELKPDFHGRQPINDLLALLGIVDQSKGEHFEESTGTLQGSLWAQESKPQCFEASRKDAHSLVSSPLSSQSSSSICPSDASSSIQRIFNMGSNMAPTATSDKMLHHQSQNTLSMQDTFNPFDVLGATQERCATDDLWQPDEIDLCLANWSASSILAWPTSTTYSQSCDDDQAFNQFIYPDAIDGFLNEDYIS